MELNRVLISLVSVIKKKKYPDKKQFREEEIILAHNSRL